MLVLMTKRARSRRRTTTSEETRARLARYKEAIGASTYEEAIIRLLRSTGTESAFGSMQGWGAWIDEDRLRARSDEGEV